MINNFKAIRGVNLGGWLLMEGYILGSPNIAESIFKERFRKIYGAKELRYFEKSFRDNFITEEDFKNISSFGANAVRVPFNYRLIEGKNFNFKEKGLKYLDKVFSLALKNNLGVILDLHAACGSQNSDWHSDSRGKALLWENKEFVKRTYSLWQVIAGRFKNKSNLIGYDVLNEPVLERDNLGVLRDFYKGLIKTIRAVDKKHIIFLEGNLWAQDIGFLEPLAGDGISVSIHFYHPLNYTFNFIPFYKFPGKVDNDLWDKKMIYRSLEKYYQFSLRNKIRIFVGEFGINWRGGYFGEEDYLKAVLSVFKDFSFDYTYWTYKAIANCVFPDGIYQYISNSPYINREGPYYGWETYLKLWGRQKNDMIAFWRTANFTPNERIILLLKKYFLLPPISKEEVI